MYMCCFCGVAVGQPSATALIPSFWQDLRAQLHQGNQIALRDAFSLLDEPNEHAAALQTLAEYTLFDTPTELNIQTASRAQAMDFFYSYREQLRFSVILHVFYCLPIEQQTANIAAPKALEGDKTAQNAFRQLLRQWIDESTERQQRIKIAQAIADLDTREAHLWLLKTFEDASLAMPVRAAMAHLIARIPSNEYCEAILVAAEKNTFDRATTDALCYEVSLSDMSLPNLRRLFDSVADVSAIRTANLEARLPFRDNFFFDRADFLGRIFCHDTIAETLREAAFSDLKALHTPKILFFLAAQVKNVPAKRAQYLARMDALTHRAVSQMLSNEASANPLAVQDFVRFWVGQVDSFEWDEGQNHFLAKADIASTTEQYERLFRRLSSDNDAVALAAFTTLTEGEPSRVTAVATQYRNLLRTYNRQLPDMRFNYLEQMTQLISTIRQFQMPTALSVGSDSLVALLLDNQAQKNRFNLENQLLAQLTFAEVSVLEYKALLYANNQDWSFSVSRVLDRFYSQNVQTWKSQPEYLRLYLKKCVLFRKIGTVGICNNYSNKLLDFTSKERGILLEILRTETDEDIRSQIEVLLNRSDDPTAGDTAHQILQHFFADPAVFIGADLRDIPKPREEDYQYIVDLIQQEHERTNIRILLDYLALHPSVAAVPHLFRIIGDERSLDRTNLTAGNVSGRVIEILEAVYNHHFKTDNVLAAWRRLWDEDQAHYTEWNKLFFGEQIQIIEAAKQISIDDINEIAASPHYQSKLHRAWIIRHLKKLDNLADIRRLRLPEADRLRASRDLAIFEPLNIAAKDLDDVLKVIDPDNSVLLWAFIGQKTTAFDLDALGGFFNALFKVTWFVRSIEDGTLGKYEREVIVNGLFRYLNNSEFISELEEQACVMHIAQLQNIGRSLTQKLAASIHLETTDNVKANVQAAILAQVRYEELPIALQYLDSLSRPANDKNGSEVTDFLRRDFGLPIFEPSPTMQRQFQQLHDSSTQAQLYQHYLQAFGVNIWTEKGDLAFDKIYDMLQFEIVQPFTGGGVQRDFFAYGIVKCLELYFKTRLGFHEKLNENQTVFTYSANRRATAWLQYLREQKLVRLAPSVVGSFRR